MGNLRPQANRLLLPGAGHRGERTGARERQEVAGRQVRGQGARVHRGEGRPRRHSGAGYRDPAGSQRGRLLALPRPLSLP